VVRADLACSNQLLEIDIYGKKYKAIVHPDIPLWYPNNERIRA